MRTPSSPPERAKRPLGGEGHCVDASTVGIREFMRFAGRRVPDTYGAVDDIRLLAIGIAARSGHHVSAIRADRHVEDEPASGMLKRRTNGLPALHVPQTCRGVMTGRDRELTIPGDAYGLDLLRVVDEQIPPMVALDRVRIGRPRLRVWSGRWFAWHVLARRVYCSIWHPDRIIALPESEAVRSRSGRAQNTEKECDREFQPPRRADARDGLCRPRLERVLNLGAIPDQVLYLDGKLGRGLDLRRRLIEGFR
jgi:hypothetical protein